MLNPTSAKCFYFGCHRSASDGWAEKFECELWNSEIVFFTSSHCLWSVSDSERIVECISCVPLLDLLFTRTGFLML